MNHLIIIRGGGDLATGTIHRLWSAGFSVLVLETERPAAIRRQVSACEAVYEGAVTVENMPVVRIFCGKEAEEMIQCGKVPILVDPLGACIRELRPEVVVDAILAKRNLGTNRSMAPLTIGLGPGFEAGIDVDLVVETMRGHDLGRLIRRGRALADTGIPGNIGGYTRERVLRAEAAGVFHNLSAIGDLVETGQILGEIVKMNGEAVPVRASIPGILRGLLRDGYVVSENFKIADIDPRKEELKNCFTISDKARCIAGSVLEAVTGHIYGHAGA